MKEFDTVLTPSFGEYTEKRSKFISAVYPCKTQTAATDILQKIKSDNFGANHNVYAYVLSDGTARFSDDGEPHGTAGKPVLEALYGSNLIDVIVVVTRYFGGVLLGTGGLVKAYTTAAQNALFAANRVSMKECAVYTAVCDYSQKDKLLSVISKHGGEIKDVDYSQNVSVEFLVLTKEKEAFEVSLKETFCGEMPANYKKTGIFPIKMQNNRGKDEK